MPTRPILITGVAGFIGSHLAQALLARGETVVGLDNFDPFYPKASKLANLGEVKGGTGQFEFAPGDITDAGAIRSLFERMKPKGVIHL
ncbi:MAG: GDP-mannose 4,6-dehydratase, partial [Phycisphaerales bacterium]